MRVPRYLLRETLAVEAYAGSGAKGPVYTPARDVRANVQDTTRMTTDSRGTQRVVDVLAIIRPEDGPLATETRVTWNGIVFRVASCMPIPDSRRPTHYELEMLRYSG